MHEMSGLALTGAREPLALTDDKRNVESPFIGRPLPPRQTTTGDLATTIREMADAR
jgi:hypothetical protein